MKWNKKDTDFLIKNYPTKGKKWCIDKLKMTEPQVRSKAFLLKLRQDTNSDFFKDWQNRARLSKIGKVRPIHSAIMKKKGKDGLLWQQNKEWTKEERKIRGELTKKIFKENGHPRGMLGKNHSKKSREQMSRSRKGKKRNLSKKQRQAISDRSSKMMALRLKNKGTIYSRSNNGWYRINRKKYYFRSGWEVVYACYLEWLRSKKEIKRWEYEPDIFWFEKIRRGVRSYCPDFKIFNNNKSIEYHEVKGYMDSKSITKIKRMAKYYPETKLIVIAKDEYYAVKKFERLFPEAIKIKK